MTVRTRFAPSPTGYLHIGGARTALFSYLYARRHGGDFVLRVEDTDLERSTPESVNAILEGMTWLNLDYDEGPFYQTQRMDRYREVIDQLMATGHAYYCYASRAELDALREAQMARGEKPRYDRRYRDFTGTPPEGVAPVIRFRNPLDGEVVVEDAVRGRVVFQNSELDDLIIARSDGTPTYNLTVVVDDWDMQITHVIRGDDHLNNTPRQINLYRALGVTPPQFAHLPMIHGPDGAKLSKRHGAVGVMQYREDGYLPDALLNYLVRLGWSHGDDEIFDRPTMVQLFDIGDINQSASSINPEKLRWLNQQYIKNLPPEQVAVELRWHLGRIGIDPAASSLDPARLVTAYADRVHTLVELAAQARPYYEPLTGYDPGALAKLDDDAPKILDALAEALSDDAAWASEAALDQTAKGVAEALGFKLGKVGPLLRLALVGQSSSPSLGVTLSLLGQAQAVDRVRALKTHLVHP
ncbi:glutamate--tRNA ligase [Halothiobacillus diazotrophicus]|uniref:Glutamate--tRNA ligase n=1 Tax=Halothiobacillus diazotrophicus TaxID=1860122 RepID=A0A191ZFT0_9GAMM|nr:glutamate--tRNA ligase [Halothiobacillus diazotrophicus]ANJ66739.1 glutamate--tRNA ligase [Halothiobacillus diazotrophicus]